MMFSRKRKTISRISARGLVFVFLLAVLFSVPMYFMYASSTTTDIAVLNAKVDLLDSLNERILNTVYWTLGVLAAIFLGLISVNLYFNITGNKREIRKIKDDVLTSIGTSVKSAEENINEKTRSLIQAEIDKKWAEILVSLKADIKTAEADISTKANTFVQGEISKAMQNSVTVLKNELLTYQAKITKGNEELGRQILTTNSTSDKLKDDILALKISIKELEAFKYSQEGKMGAIIYQIDLLEYDLLRRKWNLKYRLEDIRREVEGLYLEQKLFDKLNKLLDQITAPEHQQTIKGIREYMRIKPDDEKK